MPLIIRNDRPGLIGLAARTAIVTGTAGAVQRRQQMRYAEQQAAAEAQEAAVAATRAAAAPPAPTADSDPVAQLEKLADLQARGILSPEEFATMKARILAG